MTKKYFCGTCYEYKEGNCNTQFKDKACREYVPQEERYHQISDNPLTNSLTFKCPYCGVAKTLRPHELPWEDGFELEHECCSCKQKFNVVAETRHIDHYSKALK